MSPPPSPGSTDDGRPRCAWATGFDQYVTYHDEEWGVPVHDDRRFFEMLILEGAQAGLSWATILKKRAAYRKAFDRFDARKVAAYDRKKVASLLADAGIVRNRLKIEGAVRNARAFLDIRREFGSFDAYVWRFVGGAPIVTRRPTMRDIPPRTAESDALSKDLKKRGMTFVGSTIVYAFMQATGLVDDHVDTCFVRAGTAVTGSAGRKAQPSAAPRPRSSRARAGGTAGRRG